MEVEGAGLMACLRQVVADFQKDSGIPVAFQGSDTVELDPPAAALEVVQIVREALHNVQKHSRATRVAVSVGRVGDCLEIAIEDNGQGFAFSGSYTLAELELLRLGPQSIQRRVRDLGGDLELESSPERGSRLKIRISA